MRKTSSPILAAAILAGSFGMAFAQPYLQTAVAAADSTVTQAPAGIVFTGSIEPRFSTYSVAWPGTSVDTHPTGGTDRFIVAAADTTSIHLDHVWARPTAGPASAGAAYFTVTNDGPPDQLVGASTPEAASAGVHETIDDHGVMKMRSVPSLALDTGKPVTFKPGSYHVMLMGLKSPLKPGDSFPLTLTFAHAPPLTVTVKVEGPGGGGADRGGMQGMPGMR
jgi:periplasmic copper chaperone A